LSRSASASLTLFRFAQMELLCFLMVESLM